MIARTRGSPLIASRDRFRHRRARALAASGAVVSFLSGFGWLLLAPDQLAAIRLLGVSLAWWAAFLAHLGIGALALVSMTERQPPARS